MTSGHAATEEILRRGLSGDADERRVTLDPRFQGLPDTAHGGTILALFDAVARATGARTVAGTYRRRVPLATPLQLAIARDDAATRFRLSDGATLLVDGAVTPAALGAPGEEAAGTAGGVAPPRLVGRKQSLLPLSKTCFACGTENALGLRARLEIDDEMVSGVWTPREELRSRGSDDVVAPVALTSLLDEAAFWLGAAASGESGMTTDLHVRLHAPVSFGRRLIVGGARGTVRAHAEDPRYWDTDVAVWDEDGALVASGSITFVAVRGAARKLVAGLLAVNPPDVLRRVFPAYAP
jgi:acyl-coenzyme A thioesterase PaaI-like protein